MGTNKNKQQQKKAPSSEFKGFAEFATHQSAAATAVQHSRNLTASKPPVGLRPSPIYAGSDAHLRILFKRIGQKRDAATKYRALFELTEYAYQSSASNQSTNEGDVHPDSQASDIDAGGEQMVQLSKQDQIHALQHLVFLFTTKLAWDNKPTVRSHVLTALASAASCVSKAFVTLCTSSMGVVYILQHDPSPDVFRAATLFLEKFRTLVQQYPTTPIPPSPRNDDMNKQILSFLESVLEHSARPLLLQDYVFGVTATSSTSVLSRDGNSQDYGTSERDEMEERYERVVLSTLRAMNALVQSVPDDDKSPYRNALQHSNVQHLSSTYGPFRCATYKLIGTLCRYSVPHDNVSSKKFRLPVLILNSLNSERDPANIVTLLEMLLLYISCFRDMTGDKDNQVDSEQFLDFSATTKAVNKLINRACYGSPSGQWSPILLPFISLLPFTDNNQLQVQVLSSLWEGRTAAVGSADAAFIVSAVAECASYLLLRRRKRAVYAKEVKENCVDNQNQECAQFFLNAVAYCLSTLDGGYASMAAVKTMTDAVARDLCKLDIASYNRLDCGIYELKSWFWSEGMTRVLSSSDGELILDHHTVKRFTLFLNQTYSNRRAIEDVANDPKQTSHLSPLLRDLFHGVLSRRKGSGLLNEDEASLLLSIIEYCGVDFIFSEERVSSEATTDTAAAIETFCMNDLLRWIIIRTSSASAISPSDSSLQIDFAILCNCLKAIKSAAHRKKLCETVLREVIKAHVDVNKLAVGLIVLTNDEILHSELDSVVRCETLEKLAIHVGDKVTGQLVHGPDFEDDGIESSLEYDDTSGNAKAAFFLQTCLGLNPRSRSVLLVGPKVLKHWIESVCQGRDRTELTYYFNVDAGQASDTLLEVLLSFATTSHSIVTADDAVSLALAAWWLGGQCWDRNALEMLVGLSSGKVGQPSAFLPHVVSKASEILNKDLQMDGSPPEVLDKMCYLWSRRAWRLVKLCSLSHFKHHETNAQLVGLGNNEVWALCCSSAIPTQVETMYHCLMYLLQSFEDNVERREFLFGTNNKNSELVVAILMTAVKDCVPRPFWMDPYVGRCRRFLDLLGGVEDQSAEFLEGCCFRAIAVVDTNLQLFLKDALGSIQAVSRSVTVLDWLLGLVLGEAQPDEISRFVENAPDIVHPNEVMKGDVLWYSTEGDDLSKKWVQAAVEKIHTNDFPNLYFTIRCFDEENCTECERQTVASRLRRTKPITESSLSLPTKQDSDSCRALIEAEIMNKLVEPYATHSPGSTHSGFVAEAASECVNIMVSRCGVYGMSGLGTVRHGIIQIILRCEACICDALASAVVCDGTITAMRSLALILGYGYNTKMSIYNLSYLRYKPCLTMTKVADYFKDESWRRIMSVQAATKLSIAVLMWLTVAVGTEIDVDSLGDAILIFNAVTFHSSEGAARSLRESMPFPTLALRAWNKIEEIVFRIDPALSSGVQMAITSRLLENFVDIAESSYDGDNNKFVHGAYLLKTLPKDADAVDIAWFHPFRVFVYRNVISKRNSFAQAVAGNVDRLCESLFSPKKRWCSYQVLSLLARSRSQLPLDENVKPSEETLQRLAVWEQELAPEDVDELTEDVTVSARWIPHKLMTEIESWSEISLNQLETTEDSIFSRLLAWLAALEFLDSAGEADMRYRSRISAYIERTGSVDAVFKMSLLHANTESDKDGKWISCTLPDSHDNFVLSAVSKLVVFRTVEVLPTLTKSWFLSSCPRPLQTILTRFVENRVAPETFRRELSRLKAATDLGEMTVNGSCVSREVVATYTQDECHLSVLIKVPLSFPLRNIEVDCKKTLGISEKRWRHWSLQILRLINSQDGNILGALQLWKQNVDKEFEGVEPCPVCYSVLCVKTHAMPQLECKTCQNRFHSFCLYKWFQSSGKSQCVLCQQPWSGTKVSR